MADEQRPDSSRHHRVKAAFMAALALPAEARAAWLESACEGDERMRSEVETLLRLDGGAAGALDRGAGLREAIEDLREEPLPAAIGPYRPLRLLGRGGMGEVYLARRDDRPGEAPVAVKRIAAASLSAETRARFAREGGILSRLDHPGIARVLETGETGEGRAARPWIAMEYVDGLPLGQYAAQASLDKRARLELLARIGEAVLHAHERGVIHRDLKPENILVTAAGEPKILDFGVARLVEGDERPTERMTRTGYLVGTPQYMSPEQVQAEPARIGPPSDVYALGVIGYELLSGRVPYEASHVSLHRAVVAILTVEPPTLGTLSRELGGPSERVIAKAIQKNPAERYANAGEFAADLRRLLAGRTVHARGPSLARRAMRFAKRRRAIAASVAALALFAVLLAAWEWGRIGGPSAREVDAAYHQAEDEMVLGYPLIHSIPRVPERVARGERLMESALARVQGLPSRSHRGRLVHAIELYLGTALLVQAEWSWDIAQFDEALSHLTKAGQSPLDGGDWARDVSNPNATGLLADLNAASTLSLLGGVSMQIAELRGQFAPLKDAYWQRLQALDITRRQLGPPTPTSLAQPAQNEPYVFRYNDLAEVYVVRAEFSASPALADQALAYTDSSWARRATLQANDSAMGSVAFMRGRAFLTRGILRGVVADLDSARAYFERSFVYRGPERPVVFGETYRLLARTWLARALATRSEGAAVRRERFARADGAAHRSILALSDSSFARDRAESRAVLAEVLLERALAERSTADPDSALGLLTENGAVFSPALTPRAYRRDQVLRARVQRVKWQLSGDEGARTTGIELATRARDLSLFVQDSLVLRQARVEMSALGVQ